MVNRVSNIGAQISIVNAVVDADYIKGSADINYVSAQASVQLNYSSKNQKFVELLSLSDAVVLTTTRFPQSNISIVDSEITLDGQYTRKIAEYLDGSDGQDEVVIESTVFGASTFNQLPINADISQIQGSVDVTFTSSFPKEEDITLSDLANAGFAYDEFGTDSSTVTDETTIYFTSGHTFGSPQLNAIPFN